MTSVDFEEVWKRNKVAAFWGYPRLTFESWKERMTNPNARDHMRVVEQSFRYMNPYDLPTLLGEEQFVELWSRYRNVIRVPRWRLLDSAMNYITKGYYHLDDKEAFEKAWAEMVEIRGTHSDSPASRGSK